MKKFTLLLTSFFCLTIAHSHVTEAYTAAQADKNELRLFLNAMPKGGDLHNHLTGSIYPEDLISLGKRNHDCINDQFTLLAPQACSAHTTLDHTLQDSSLYLHILDALSIRNTAYGNPSVHENFFDVFGKTSIVKQQSMPEFLALALNQAALSNLLYAEFMLGFHRDLFDYLSTHTRYDTDFKTQQRYLNANNFQHTIDIINARIDKMVTQANTLMQCHTKRAQAGCSVNYKLQYEILRNMPPNTVFAETYAAFLIANQNKQVVAINIVQAEELPYAQNDYALHMQMIHYFHSQFPNVKISLHAGEITLKQATPLALSHHIHDAISIGDAQRIGHGVDIAYEKNALATLNTMANNQIDVEINLTSNLELLNVSGEDHPLRLYLTHKVPVSLSTDDEGLLRTDMNNEFLLAAFNYSLPYTTLKNINRNSLTYSFLEGKSLWADPRNARTVNACAQDILGSETISKSCQTFLESSEKARIQWLLEQKLSVFEQQFDSMPREAL
jgi:adenosine deaminase